MLIPSELRTNFLSTFNAMPYTLAPASEAHYPDLHRAIDIVAREEKFLAFTQAPPFEQSFSFYRALKACGAPHFVVLDGETVVGWVDVSPQMGEARAHIGTLGIALVPGVRRQGLGERLLRTAIGAAWAKGLTRIELSVRADNARAIALYERCGFVHEGTLRRGFCIAGQSYDVHVMALLR